MIELATKLDLNDIMRIMNEIKKEMKANGNPQWGDEVDYPNEEIVLNDITNHELYVYKENGIIKGVLTITKDHYEYRDLLVTSEKPAYILHRLAIKKEYRQEGIANSLLNYAEKLAKYNRISILKSDTEKHNLPMQHLFAKHQFIKYGEFDPKDHPGHYIYYEKEIK